MKYFHKVYEGSEIKKGISIDFDNHIFFLRWDWGKRTHEIRIRHYWAGIGCTVRHAPKNARYWDKPIVIKTRKGEFHLGDKGKE